MAEPDHDSKVPVLTEVVAGGRPPRPVVDAAALEALARELERAVLAQLAPEVDRVIESVRSELTASVTRLVREAVAASVAHALQSRGPK
jgi:hypothetical protein